MANCGGMDASCYKIIHPTTGLSTCPNRNPVSMANDSCDTIKIPASDRGSAIHFSIDIAVSSSLSFDYSSAITMLLLFHQDSLIKVMPCEEEREAMDLSTKSPTKTPSPRDAGPTDMQMANFPCHTCGEVFSTRSQQEQHVAEKHSG